MAVRVGSGSTRSTCVTTRIAPIPGSMRRASNRRASVALPSHDLCNADAARAPRYVTLTLVRENLYEIVQEPANVCSFIVWTEYDVVSCAHFWCRPAGDVRTDMNRHRPTAIAVGRDDHVAADDWAILTTDHPSVLLIGPAAATQTIVSELRPYLRSPASWWAHDAEPGPLPIAGTLIIRDVGALDLDLQRRLLDWVEAQGHDVQVVSVSGRPVVETGAFLAALYYRLNIVCLHLAATPRQS